jgi:hypothetical protein
MAPRARTRPEEDEADAVNAPPPPHLSANVAAALSEPHAHEALPSNLVSRTTAATAAGAAAGAALARQGDAEAQPRATAAPSRAAQLRRERLSPQVTALCAVAAAASMLFNTGELQEAGGTWLLRTMHFVWIAHREAPFFAVAWVLATCFFGVAVMARYATSAELMLALSALLLHAAC